MRTSTKGEKIRRKFHKRMETFIAKGGSLSYDNDNIDVIEVRLRYKHPVTQCTPKDIPEINTSFLSMKGYIAFPHHHYMVWGYFPWIA